jgi:hypothetical protein
MDLMAVASVEFISTSNSVDSIPVAFVDYGVNFDL